MYILIGSSSDELAGIGRGTLHKWVNSEISFIDRDIRDGSWILRDYNGHKFYLCDLMVLSPRLQVVDISQFSIDQLQVLLEA